MSEELKPYTPSWRERLHGALFDALTQKLNVSKSGADNFVEGADNIMGMVPGLGNALSANDAYRDYQGGNYLGAALNGAMALPIPGANVVEGAGRDIGSALKSSLMKRVMTNRISENLIDSLPVRLNLDGTMGRYDSPRVVIGRNGMIDVFQHPSAQPPLSSTIENAVNDKFNPKYDHFFRFTNNRNEPNLLASGDLRNSYNHADNVPEQGLSVANGPHYGIRGYKYGYGLKGDVIGYGADGEPLLDPKRAQIVGGLRSSYDIVSRDKAESSKLMKAMGWSSDHRAAVVTGAMGRFKFLTPEEYSKYLVDY